MSSRETPAVLRPPLLGLAALEVGLAVMTASRGWLFTLPLVMLLVLALTPGRIRFILAVLVVGLAVVPALDALLESVRAGGGRSVEESTADTVAAVRAALGPLVLAGMAAVAAGIVWVLADRRLVMSPMVGHVVGRTVGALAVVAVAGGAFAVISAEPRPDDRLERAWEEFKANDTSTLSGAERFPSTGSSRYDFWRVAADVTADHPFLGVGQDNFAEPYVARRATDNEEPRWVHSLPLRALAHTGVVGAILLAVALGALAAGAIRVRGRPEDRDTAALALVPLVVWTVHGSVDWLWEFPVLSAIALGLAAGAGNAPIDPADDVVAPRRSRRLMRAGGVGVVAVAVAGVLAVAAAYVANRDVRLAATGWPADPAGAFERLDQATALTPSARPYRVEAIIAERLGDRSRARRALRDAARREPSDWFAPFQLGLFAAEDGNARAARGLYADAARMNPRDPVLRAARRALARGKPFTTADAERMFRERARRRFGE